jgi:hypothetical protein
MEQVIYCQYNFGHTVGFWHPHYEILPEIFAYSDPDLQFSPTLPPDFLNILSSLAATYKVFKVGMALRIDPDRQLTPQTKRRFKTDPFPYRENMTVTEWESQHWRFPLLADGRLALYVAPIDTTFAVYRKSNYLGNFFDAIRVSGDFDAIHLPWFPELDLMNRRQKETYLTENRATTWVR